MALPGARDTANLTTLYASTVEKYLDETWDLVRTEMLAIQLAEELGIYQTTKTSHHTIFPVIDSETTQAIAFDGLDTLPNGKPKGVQGITYGYKQYAVPVVQAWTDIMDMPDGYSVVDDLEVTAYKAAVDIGKRIDTDLISGSVADSKKINGIEQAIFPATDAASADTFAEAIAAKRWSFRQAANTYLGVARSAFTADGVGGTHWENVSSDFDISLKNFTSGEGVFKMVSDNPSESLKLFNHIFTNIAGIGRDYPDLIFSTPRPRTDFEHAGWGLIRFQRQEFNGLHGLGFSDITFKGAQWAASEKFACSALLAAQSGIATGLAAGADMIYGINSRTWTVEVSEGADFALTEMHRADRQLAWAMYLVWRGQSVFKDPRRNFVIAQYGTA